MRTGRHAAGQERPQLSGFRLYPQLAGDPGTGLDQTSGAEPADIPCGLEGVVKPAARMTGYAAVSDSNNILSFALRVDAIAVSIKNKIHAGIFICRLLVETASLLLLPAAGCADGNDILFAETYFAKLHDDYLLHHLLNPLSDSRVKGC